MIIFDESGEVVESPDLATGEVTTKTAVVSHSWVVDSDEQGHWEVVAEYESGGRDVSWVVDSPEVGHWDTRDEDGAEVEHFDGPIADDWPHEQVITDIWQYGIYRPYTDEELAEMEREREEEEEAQRQAQAIQDGSRAFFLDGGREQMQSDIERAAQSGGADPAVASFVMLAMPMVAPTAKDSALASVMKYAPDYVPEGHAYKKGEVFRTEDGRYWRVSQDFTSQSQWVPGGAGLDALFYSIDIAPDGIIVWSQPHGDYDAPDEGDKRHYPDADGPVYVSLVNGNSYSPDAYPQNWEQVG